MGVSSGALSSTSAATAGTGGLTAGDSSSSSSSTRSARTATCCFSSETLVTRGPSLACRKKVRCPGVPPSRRRTGRGVEVEDRHASDLTSALPRPATHRCVTRVERRIRGGSRACAGLGGLGRRHEPGQVAARVVDPDHERTPVGVAHHRQRARVDVRSAGTGPGERRAASARIDLMTSPCETATQRASGPWSRRPRRRWPGRRRWPAAASRRSTRRLLAGEAGGAGVVLHDPPERLVGQVLQRATGPRAVAALPQVVDRVDGERAERVGEERTPSRRSAAAGWSPAP